MNNTILIIDEKHDISVIIAGFVTNRILLLFDEEHDLLL